MEKQLTIVPQQIKTCAFTGHRELGYDFSAKTFEKEIAELIERGAEIFYNGMARGFDLFAAETVLKLKKKYPQIKFVACVPCLEQEKGFSERDKTRIKRSFQKRIKRSFCPNIIIPGVCWRGTGIWRIGRTYSWRTAKSRRAARRTRWSISEKNILRAK